MSTVADCLVFCVLAIFSGILVPNDLDVLPELLPKDSQHLKTCLYLVTAARGRIVSPPASNAPLKVQHLAADQKKANVSDDK